MKREPWDTLQNQLWHTAGCSFCSADQLPLSTIFQLLWHNLLVISHCCQLQWCKTAVVLTLVTLSLIWAIRIAKKRTWSPSLRKKIVSPILKEIRSWNYFSIYSKMRDFALLRLQALFISDHANAQDQGSGWLKYMGFCLHKQTNKKSVQENSICWNLSALCPGSQVTVDGRYRHDVSPGYMKGLVFLWLNLGWIQFPFHKGPFHPSGQYTNWQCSNILC